MKAISYALFGYRKTYKNCFDFTSYLRGLMINIRINRIIYPNWVNVLSIDEESWASPYAPILSWLQDKGLLVLNLCPNNEPLCKAMIWRLKPAFFVDEKEDWEFTHVLFRDCDSVGTYREAQAVHEWIQEDKTIHCITDSISHNVYMMGGMTGVRPSHFSFRMAVNTWQQLLDTYTPVNLDWHRKGADQDFLNQCVYPRCADSSTEHYILGMAHNLAEGNGRHYRIDQSIDVGHKELESDLNALAGHIGAAGAYTTPLDKFLYHLDPYRDEYKEIETEFKNIFYWRA